MSKQAFVSFSCDNHECDNTTVGESEDTFLIAPAGWWTLDRPDGIVTRLDDDTLHFCSVLCLAGWAINQTHLRHL